MKKQFDIKEVNKSLRAKGDGKRNGLKLPASAIAWAKKVLRDAALLNNKVTTAAKVEKLVKR
jgi:hypothetical protein